MPHPAPIAARSLAPWRGALLGLVTIALLGLFTAAAEAASRSTARATAPLPLHERPWSSSDILGRLPKDLPVHLERCTRRSEWCLVILDGAPAGWVLGSYLVGSAAKTQVTPPEFEYFDPLDPLPSRPRRPF